MRTLLTSITEAAQLQIQRIRQQYKDQAGVESIPAIAWIDAKMNPALAASGVCIGLYHESDRDEIADGICEIDGMECVMSVTEKNEELFMGKTLDFNNGWILK